MTDIWVIFDATGDMVFYTFNEEYANFDKLHPSKYNVDDCVIVHNPPGYFGEPGFTITRNMTTGEITVVPRASKSRN